ncbi:acyl-CoA dehydrogenase family protein [Gulosibacter chungangensis]|uniref:acyl-CoA dehydrogenase family protein n=1 Tax=Gulosibacter chungangensis TaxID=979746 RepID=UPI001CE43D81|nr:acyl-CoA dehydrogenase family protein [Gulosibacter chungangensis]
MTSLTAQVLLQSGTATDEDLKARFAPVIARIAEGNVDRELTRTLPHEQVRWLTEAGLGVIRVPESAGGLGASLRQTFLVLADLAEADANIAHIWRNHLAFVEDRLAASARPETDPAVTERWLKRFLAGDFVGGGWTEANNGTYKTLKTLITPHEDGAYRISGAKFYATGSLYADWLDVIGKTEDGQFLTALVPRHQPGVELVDDWPGFGQQTTSSGSATYRDAVVQGEDLFRVEDRFSYQGLFYQTSLLSVLTGIGRAIERDGIVALRERGRNYTHGLDEVPHKDPQLLQIIGQVHTLRYIAEIALEKAASSLDVIALAQAAGDTEAGQDALIKASIEVTQAQIAITDSVLREATLVFDALGASGTTVARGLDRHWRNARTIANHNPRVYKERILGNYLVNGENSTDSFTRQLTESTGGQGQG